MHTGSENTALCSFYRENIDLYTKDTAALSQALKDNHVVYGNWTLSCEATPLVLTPREAQLLTDASEKLLEIAERITAYWLHHPNWRTRFPWPEEFSNLVAHHPGYSRAIPCARIDTFLDNDKLAFIELNTDGCSGMSNTDIFHHLYATGIGQRPEAHLSDATHWSVMPTLRDTLIGCYQEFCENATHMPAEPTVVILDNAHEKTGWEFHAVRNFLRENGIDAHIAAPEDATYENGVLSFNGIHTHIIYRRLLGADYMKNMERLTPVSAAFTEGNVCMVGSPRSHIAFTKRLFADMHAHDIFSALPSNLQDIITKHVPWTCHMTEESPVYHGTPIDLIAFLRKNQEKCVLKPCDSKCGEGIYMGKHMEKDEWNAAVESVKGTDYIVQEYVPLVQRTFPRFGTKAPQEKRYVHVGAYVFGGKFCGVLSRTCAHPLLNLAHGERLLATFTTHTH